MKLAPAILSGLVLAGQAIAQTATTSTTTAAVDPFTMPTSSVPVPGQYYEITWTPTSGGTVDLYLNNWLQGTPSVITTSTGFAYSLPNNGSYSWLVPSNLCGKLSFSLYATLHAPLSFSTPFTIPCPTPTGLTSKFVTYTIGGSLLSALDPGYPTTVCQDTYECEAWVEPTTSVVGPQPVGPESAPLTSSKLLPSPVGPETASLSTSLPTPTIIYLPGPSNHNTPIVPSPTPFSTSSEYSSGYPLPTIATTFPQSFFASLLGITSCSDSILPSPTNFVAADGTTISFLTLGCGTTPFDPFATTTATGTMSTKVIPMNCYPGYGFPASASHSVSVCCPPGGWSTTTLGPAESDFPNLYCVTSITAAAQSTPSTTSATTPTATTGTTTSKLLPSPIGPETGISGISAISAATSQAIARRQYYVVETELVYVKAATTTVGVSGSSSASSGTAVGGPVGSPIQAPTSSLMISSGSSTSATVLVGTATGVGVSPSASASASVTAHSSVASGRIGYLLLGWQGVGGLLALGLGMLVWAL